jgi:hypothetical protein
MLWFYLRKKPNYPLRTLIVDIRPIYVLLARLFYVLTELPSLYVNAVISWSFTYEVAKLRLLASPCLPVGV